MVLACCMPWLSPSVEPLFGRSIAGGGRRGVGLLWAAEGGGRAGLGRTPRRAAEAAEGVDGPRLGRLGPPAPAGPCAPVCVFNCGFRLGPIPGKPFWFHFCKILFLCPCALHYIALLHSTPLHCNTTTQKLPASFNHSFACSSVRLLTHSRNHNFLSALK